MIYFYALIANATHKKRIPKSFLTALKQLEDLNVLQREGESYALKSHFIIGSVDISRSGKIFIKSFNTKDENDFLLENGRYALKKGDIILAKKLHL